MLAATPVVFRSEFIHCLITCFANYPLEWSGQCWNSLCRDLVVAVWKQENERLIRLSAQLAHCLEFLNGQYLVHFRLHLFFGWGLASSQHTFLNFPPYMFCIR